MAVRQGRQTLVRARRRTVADSEAEVAAAEVSDALPQRSAPDRMVLMPQEHGPWQAFDGIRIIGDVHGDAAAFSVAIAEASARHLFVIQLGDLVDRGPDSVGALRLALDLIDRGRGLFLRANHDDKLRRALRGNPVRIGRELARTLEALAAAPDQADLLPRLREALEQAPWWLRLGNHLLVHGA